MCVVGYKLPAKCKLSLSHIVVAFLDVLFEVKVALSFLLYVLILWHIIIFKKFTLRILDVLAYTAEHTYRLL